MLTFNLRDGMRGKDCVSGGGAWQKPSVLGMHICNLTLESNFTNSSVLTMLGFIIIVVNLSRKMLQN
jgi:hypothetical protein